MKKTLYIISPEGHVLNLIYLYNYQKCTKSMKMTNKDNMSIEGELLPNKETDVHKENLYKIIYP